jgi:UDP-GlcNAc:undecaprenyl-phosphate GlcNAc-1-phosphate transferase
MLDQVYSPQTRPQKQDDPVVICGADDSGEIALRWILQQPNLGFRPVGFIDDDPFKWGRQIHGIRVIGDINQIENSVQNQAIKGVILTSTTPIDNDETEKILDVCQKCGLWVRRLHVEFDLVE